MQQGFYAVLVKLRNLSFLCKFCIFFHVSLGSPRQSHLDFKGKNIIRFQSCGGGGGGVGGWIGTIHAAMSPVLHVEGCRTLYV